MENACVGCEAGILHSSGGSLLHAVARNTSFPLASLPRSRAKPKGDLLEPWNYLKSA